MSAPFQSICPASAPSTPRAIRIVVVLPAPFAPRKPKTSPLGTSKVSPSSATTLPKRLWRSSICRLIARGRWAGSPAEDSPGPRPSSPDDGPGPCDDDPVTAQRETIDPHGRRTVDDPHQDARGPGRPDVQHRLVGRSRDGLRLHRPPLPLPVRLLPGRGRAARLARLGADADRRADPDDRHPPRRQLRRRRRTGATATRPGSTRSSSSATAARAPSARLDEPPSRTRVRGAPIATTTSRVTAHQGRQDPASPRARGSTDDHLHDAVHRRPSGRRDEGPDVRPRRPQPGLLGQPDRRRSARSAAARSTSTRRSSRTPAARRSTGS